MLLSVATSFVACGNSSEDSSSGSTTPPDTLTCSIEDIELICTSDKTSTFAKIVPVFSDPDKAEPLTYSYNTTAINIDEDGIVTVKRLQTQKVPVMATSENTSTKFNVNVNYVNIDELTNTEVLYNYDRFQTPYESMKARCKDITSDTTLVIGDSFTDDYFIRDWLTGYKTKGGKTKYIVNAGISSTTSFHWQAMCASLIGKKVPKNIVINIGTNDFYDEHIDVERVEESIQQLVMFLHSKYKTSKIYLFTINQRLNTKYATEVDRVNATMKAFANEWDWLTSVETCSLLTSDYLKDGIHPKKEGYDLMFNALESAGIEYAYVR